MKKFRIALLPVLFLFASCLKAKDTGCRYDACATVAPQAEINAVQAYLTQNNISGAVQHCSGAYYKILDGGSGDAATACSSVTATYQGRFTNGSQFDAGTATFSLGSVIKGWTNLVPLVKEGGHILMYIPPSLGYGPNNYGSIPGNSILIFDVTLVDVQ
ncbi:FKBP-type peptidyl-prolyl cis-trans isomerase [Flaviaesturariibacter terrae]